MRFSPRANEDEIEQNTKLSSNPNPHTPLTDFWNWAVRCKYPLHIFTFYPPKKKKKTNQKVYDKLLYEESTIFVFVLSVKCKAEAPTRQSIAWCD